MAVVWAGRREGAAAIGTGVAIAGGLAELVVVAEVVSEAAAWMAAVLGAGSAAAAAAGGGAGALTSALARLLKQRSSCAYARLAAWAFLLRPAASRLAAATSFLPSLTATCSWRFCCNRASMAWYWTAGLMFPVALPWAAARAWRCTSVMAE